MTLRSRLLAGFAIVFVVVAVASAFIVSAQRSRLYDQVDEQLMATPLPVQARVGPAVRGPAPVDRAPRADGQAAAEATPVDVESISDLYIAVIAEDGLVRPAVQGQLLQDIPDIAALAAAQPGDPVIVTVPGVEGVSTFRALAMPATETSFATITAVPIDDVDEAVRQLTLTFVGLAVLILLVLALIASWVNRFGLRPISAMTDVAEAISSGDRDRRAAVDAESTEAGRLGHAFNVMLDERDQSDARLRKFVSNASHELRTPLTSIRGYLDLYDAGGFREPGQLDDAVRRMRIESERMHVLVEDLLVLAKFDEEQPLDISTVDIGELLDDVAAIAGVAHPNREITVEALDARQLDVDRLRLHQAIAALVDNAVRHTPDDASIRIAAVDADGAVEVSVADSGPGLTAAEAEAVFDRFVRGDRSRARKTGGSGLGLSITQAIVQAHGGEIDVTATPGVGATFTITLPATSGAAQAGLIS